MNFGDNDGPTLRTIPERNFNFCSGCKYHNHFMIHSGRNPLYGNHCEHPDRPHKDLELFGKGQGNLGTGNDVRTPKWCPFLNK